MKTICETCGIEFEISPSRLKYGRGKNCSKNCQSISVSKKNTKEKVKFNCLNCGKEFSLLECQIENKIGAGKWCSRSCRDLYRIGKNHPLYIGERFIKRGANWQSQKRKALIRDNYTCQTCGDNNNLNIHHIKPYRFFNNDYKKANRLNNLICLCSSCHRKEDYNIQKNKKYEY